MECKKLAQSTRPLHCGVVHGPWFAGSWFTGPWFTAGWIVLAAAVCSSPPARGQESYAQNEARLKEMTPDQKQELRRKKFRFDELSAEEQQHLRELHHSIVTDPNAEELVDTVTRYNRWLANLDASERSDLLDIKEPEKRIERIKELMRKQEERRFLAYAGNLPENDRTTIYNWLREFVAAHADEIRQRAPSFIRQRIDDAPDEAARREQLFMHWQRARRDGDMPFPRPSDLNELFEKFSPETQKTIEAAAANKLTSEPEDQRTPQRQQALEQERVGELVRMALWARYFPQISLEELLKYYAAMKSDDPRRKLVQGKEGEELRRELQRM